MSDDGELYKLHKGKVSTCTLNKSRPVYPRNRSDFLNSFVPVSNKVEEIVTE